MANQPVLCKIYFSFPTLVIGICKIYGSSTSGGELARTLNLWGVKQPAVFDCFLFFVGLMWCSLWRSSAYTSPLAGKESVDQMLLLQPLWISSHVLTVLVSSHQGFRLLETTSPCVSLSWPGSWAATGADWSEERYVCRIHAGSWTIFQSEADMTLKKMFSLTQSPLSLLCSVRFE